MQMPCLRTAVSTYNHAMTIYLLDTTTQELLARCPAGQTRLC